jgi:recombination associated protein RdgC
MGLLTGGMTVRRFRVAGELPAEWREVYRDRLEKMAFREPTQRMGKEEVEGWVQIHNLLDTSFEDLNRWLYNDYAMFSLRVDKKSLPAKLFKATVEKKCQAWCAERSVERVPSAVKKEIREKLEAEWLDRTLPRVSLTEVCWNVSAGWVLVGGLSDRVADRIRKRFHRTFGLEMVPWSPLDALDSSSVRDTLLNSAPTATGGES